MEQLNKINAENNIKIYKKYKMFAYDFLFFYAIQIMFLTNTKGFTMSQVMYNTAFYTLFLFLFQIPCNFLIKKLNIRNSIVIGNILACINIILYLFVSSFSGIVLAGAFGALGFTLKNLAEGTLLYISLKEMDYRNKFSKIEGKSNSKFYYYDAVSAILSGFLFIINNYLPIILCLINIIIALFFSFKFKNIIKENYENDISIKKMIKKIKNLFTLNRAKSLFLYSFVFMGIVTVFGNLFKLILIDLGLKTQYITMVICLFTVMVGIGAKSIYYIEKLTKNKTLTTFGIIFVVNMLIVGLCSVINNLNLLMFAIILFALSVMGIIQGAYRVAIKKYILSFTTSRIRTEITSVYYIFENLGGCIISILIGLLLNVTTTSLTTVIFSMFSFLAMILVSIYMKGKLGLKPEQYENKEIYK